MSGMKLFGYYRSSAAYRVRIALALKGLDAEQVPVHLRKGEQSSPGYAALNPAHLVPVLGDGELVLTQSLAIIEYLDETHPEPPLLPGDPAARARIRSLALSIACDIHPLNNLRVLRYLVRTLELTEERKNDWYRHWIATGFAALEAMLTREAGTGTFCHAEVVSLADVCLVPQVYNAERFGCDLGPFPTIRRIAETCRALPAFEQAAPENQPDAE